MNILSIAFGVTRYQLKTPFVTALRRVEEVEAILVRIETSGGRVGYGETAPTEAITGATPGVILSDLHRLRAALSGANPATWDERITLVQSLPQASPNARAAMEIALYDLAAQAADQALVEYLGGAPRPLETGVTISLGSARSMVAQARQAWAEGFGSLKIKLGSDAAEDLNRIMAIHDALGDHVRYKLDANQGWEVHEAITFLNALEARGLPIELIEQPLPRDDLAGLATIRRHSSIPVLLDESVFTPADAVRAIEQEAADCINIKLDKSGGISPAMAIVDLCADAGVPCMMGCMMEGPVSVGAAAHVAAAYPETITMIDLDAPMLCRALPVRGGVRFDHPPAVVIPPVPGLGIEGIEGLSWM
jgi:L-alanine-DL-glutamate epimerase-like enolase superfamily enzyme